MDSKQGGIVRRNAKVLIILTVLSVPIMTLFQNCGKTQAISISDVGTTSKAGAVVNTNDLPAGNTQIDQIGSGSEVVTGGGSSDVPASGDGSSADSGSGAGSRPPPRPGWFWGSP